MLFGVAIISAVIVNAVVISVWWNGVKSIAVGVVVENSQECHIFLALGKARNPLHLSRKNDSWTSKNASRPIFGTFDLELCFAPQRRAFFRQLKFLKVSRSLGLFCAF